jgi:hypothetical protein
MSVYFRVRDCDTACFFTSNSLVTMDSSSTATRQDQVSLCPLKRDLCFLPSAKVGCLLEYVDSSQVAKRSTLVVLSSRTVAVHIKIQKLMILKTDRVVCCKNLEELLMLQVAQASAFRSPEASVCTLFRCAPTITYDSMCRSCIFEYQNINTTTKP